MEPNQMRHDRAIALEGLAMFFKFVALLVALACAALVLRTYADHGSLDNANTYAIARIGLPVFAGVVVLIALIKKIAATLRVPRQ